MNCYGPLASKYDGLTGDVPYSKYADTYEAEFRRDGGEFRLLLDLCCGTGSLTQEMCARGYELIAADASVDMLMQAQAKNYDGISPLFLCQRAEELDLYGTVDAAYCSLDSLNYIPPAALPEIFHRLHLFIRPGGLFIFDIRTPEWLRSLDGEIFLDENEDTYCIWRADYEPEENSVTYGMDLFSRAGKLWKRAGEEHTEYIHEPEILRQRLLSAGFTDLTTLDNTPDRNAGRLFFCARRSWEDI